MIKIPAEASALNDEEMMTGGMRRWRPKINQMELLNVIKKNETGDSPLDVCPPSKANN